MTKIDEAEGIILDALTPLDVLSKFLQDHPVGASPLCAASVGDLLRPYVEALLAKHQEAFELLRGLTGRALYASEDLSSAPTSGRENVAPECVAPRPI